MKKDKFLTVYAVLGKKTQEILNELQSQILLLGDKGTQTMGIPFHISLGSFPVADEECLASKIHTICSQYKRFSIELNAVNHFNNNVLFIEPKYTKELEELHNMFNNNYADGFPWHAHVTIFCSDENNVKRAMKVLTDNFNSFTCEVIGLEMGEFFPVRKIVSKDFV